MKENKGYMSTRTTITQVDLNRRELLESYWGGYPPQLGYAGQRDDPSPHQLEQDGLQCKT